MLLGNYSALNSNPGRGIGCAYTNPYQWLKGGTLNNYFYGEQYMTGQTIKNSLPTGTEPPYSYRMGIKGGELSSTTQINGDSSLTAGLAQGINILADLDGTSSLTASLGLITSLVATLAGTSSLSASMVGVVQMESDLAGSSSVTASLNILANLAATLAGTSAVTAALRGTATFSAAIYVNSGAATVQEIAAGVWSEDLTDYSTAGTAGKTVKQIKSMTAAQL